MYLAGGVVAPKNLIGSADCFSGQHLPGGAGVTRASGRAHEGDRCDHGANAGVGLAGAVMANKVGVALRFDRGEGGTDDRIGIEIKLEGGFQPPAGAGVGIHDAGIGACPGPV